MSSNRFDRRRFLKGAGATLALPMLEALMPRAARGQTVSPPKRLLIVHHQDGRLIGDGRTTNGVLNDWWSPARATGPLPTGLSPMLAALEPIRNEVVTVDGVDNLVRHCVDDIEGHIPAQKTLLTCRALVAGKVVAPSFDYVMGTRLRANTTMRPSIVVCGTAADYAWRTNNVGVFFGANGSAPAIIDPDPAKAITELFGSGATMTPPPPTPTLQDRLASQRQSVLDGVLGSFTALRGRVSASDRARLDSHAEFVRGLELRAAGGADGGTAAMPGMGCVRPDPALVPSNTNGSGGTYLRGEKDGVMMPAIIENLAQAFACDVTRVASLFFWNGDDPIFPTEFSGTSPFQARNWHGTIHGVPEIARNAADSSILKSSFNFYARSFTQLVQRLASITELDGSRLLDNTLVLWVSEMGYGAVHVDYDIPVVLAGMKGAFARGQGRHLVCNRRSMGDLLAQVMRMFGGTDTTFGDTGTIGDHNAGDIQADAGWSVTRTTPLHAGALDL